MTKRQAHSATPEQLTLLAVSDLPIQFRLDQRTRERGLAHIAAIRRQLAAKATTDATVDYGRHHQAA
jgi:2',3'-cyclic-nucleotide 2'-phosphodiesterase (5'-nucleotidase family)